MNALTTYEPRTPAAAPRRDVGKALEAMEAKHLHPIRSTPWGESARDLMNRSEFENVSREDMPERARELLRDMPTVEALRAYQARAERLIGAPPDRKDTRAMIALMLAAFPNSRAPDLAAYADSLLHYAVSDGYSPTVVAQACGDVVRSLAFTPSVSEFLKACEDAKTNLRSPIRVAEFLAHRRGVVEQRAAR